MPSYVTREGDQLDHVLWLFNSKREVPGEVERTLDLNPGLSGYGAILPSGLTIQLPEASIPQQAQRLVTLWRGSI